MKAAKTIMSPALKLVGLIKKKPPKAPNASPSITRDIIDGDRALEDEIRRRRGGASDRVTGTGGAEAGSTGNVQLG